MSETAKKREMLSLRETLTPFTQSGVDGVFSSSSSEVYAFILPTKLPRLDQP